MSMIQLGQTFLILFVLLAGWRWLPQPRHAASAGRSPMDRHSRPSLGDNSYRKDR
jgi:hypothetical protein